MGHNEISRTMINNLMKKTLPDDGISRPTLFANLPKNTKINVLTADENTPNLLDGGKYTSMNGRIIKRLPFDTIASPVEQKRKFVLDHIERNPVDIRDIKEYDNLIKTQNFAGFLNKASLDASRQQERSLEQIAKNSKEAKIYLQSLKDRIKNIEAEIQKRQQTQGPFSSIGNISPIKPVQRRPQDSAPAPITQMTKDELISEDLSEKLQFLRTYETIKTCSKELDEIDPAIAQIAQMKAEGRTEEEINGHSYECGFLTSSGGCSVRREEREKQEC